MNYNKISQAMVAAATEAAVLIKEDFDEACSGGSVGVVSKDDKSGLPDFVTATDKRAETAIIKILKKQAAGISIVSEEVGGDASLDSYFLIDPLDGTSNFVARRDYFAVSIAYIEDGEVKASIIYDPCRSVYVSAISGQGAHTNGGVRVFAAQNTPMKKKQLECELAFNTSNDTSLLLEVVHNYSGMRKSGSTALDLMNLALGRPIDIVASNLEPYDLASGLLIAREAGAEVMDIDSRTSAIIETRDIIASSDCSQFLRLIHPHEDIA